MAVQFNAIPSNILVPLFYAEFNSGGTPYQNIPRLLLVGQKLSGGTALANQAYGPIASEDDAIAQFGLGSMLHYMYLSARGNAQFIPIYALPLADPAGASATGTVVFGTAPGITGLGAVRITGVVVTFQINASDTTANMATNLAAQINLNNLPFTATASTNTVTLTYRHVGAAGNGLDVSLPGVAPVPANGLSNLLTATNTTITAPSGGSGVPVLTTALANLVNIEYDWIAGAYADTTSLNAVGAFLNDQTGRWSPYYQLYGHYVTATYGTLSALTTLGAGRNDQHASIIGMQTLPTPPYQVAAAAAAVACAHMANPPECSRPLQTLPLYGVLPPDAIANWWHISDRQALYATGIGALNVMPSRLVQIDRLVTTYQYTASGAPDATFRDLEKMGQGMYGIRYLRTYVLQRYGRAALAPSDPYNVGLATPKSIKNDLIHAYNDLVALGLASSPQTFQNYVQVQINALDPTRVDVLFPIEFVNQLRIFAANVTAYLSYVTPSGGVAIPATGAGLSAL